MKFGTIFAIHGNFRFYNPMNTFQHLYWTFCLFSNKSNGLKQFEREPYFFSQYFQPWHMYFMEIFVFSTLWTLLNIFNTCSACLQTKKEITSSNCNGPKIFAITTYLNKAMLESIYKIVKTKISMYCKYCANFHGSTTFFFRRRISNHFKDHLHQFQKLYPKMHYFAIFEGLQTLLIHLDDHCILGNELVVIK